MDQKIIKIIATLAVIATLIGLVFIFNNKEDSTSNVVVEQEVSAQDPLDIVMDFYNPWLDAVKSTSTNPYTLGLGTNPILSVGLRNMLTSSDGRSEADIDPVLCQATIPERVTTRIVSEQAETMRILVLAREKELSAQSVFTLKRQNDGWYIDTIECTPGEFDVPREFTFEKEGYLFKNENPPLNPDYWYIVFEENGEQGHFVPLFFNEESICKQFSDGTEAVCAPSEFINPIKIVVRGQMTESGVELKRLEFLE